METTGFIRRGLAVDGRKMVELVNFGESGEFGEWSLRVLVVFKRLFVDFQGFDPMVER